MPLKYPNGVTPRFPEAETIRDFILAHQTKPGIEDDAVIVQRLAESLNVTGDAQREQLANAFSNWKEGKSLPAPDLLNALVNALGGTNNDRMQVRFIYAAQTKPKQDDSIAEAIKAVVAGERASGGSGKTTSAELAEQRGERFSQPQCMSEMLHALLRKHGKSTEQFKYYLARHGIEGERVDTWLDGTIMPHTRWLGQIKAYFGIPATQRFPVKEYAGLRNNDMPVDEALQKVFSPAQRVRGR